MKKVISFSLWGTSQKYTIGAIENAKLALEYYPGWVCRYYIASSVPEEIIQKLNKFKNTEIILMEEEGDWTGMFWRFYAASDPSVSIMISRDCDSRLGYREKMAVQEWENSNKDFHIMRDHPHHATEILGGMWGCKSPLLLDMISFIKEYKKKGNFWQVDQNFLREIIHPIIKNNAFVHDEFFQNMPFPVDRNGLEFVGQVFDKDNNQVLEYLEPLKRALGIK
tara:strand:+ start:430 stop:1098 length:669 start_codon:yes stop_codon:yes gene_type:complete